MKAMLISVILLFLMPVPDTDTFSLTDVADEIENNGGQIVLSLQDAFDQADPDGFADDPNDPRATYFDTYGYSLLAFRNYHYPAAITTITVSPTSITFLDLGGTKTVTVTTAANDTWTVTKPKFDLWITYNTSSGTGSGSFTLTTIENTDVDRTSTITVTSSLGEKTIAITQTGGGQL
jgi:hypothetical protein